MDDGDKSPARRLLSSRSPSSVVLSDEHAVGEAGHGSPSRETRAANGMLRPVTPSRTTTSLSLEVDGKHDDGSESLEPELRAAIDETGFQPPPPAPVDHLRDRLQGQTTTAAAAATTTTDDELAGKPVELERRQSWFSNGSAEESLGPVLQDQYFVLTAAGKPVYSRHGTYDVARLAGILSSLFANFAKDKDALRSIKTSGHTITFLQRGALYLVSVTYTALPETVLRAHLDILHAQIIFALSTRRVDDMLKVNWNYNLSRQLEGEEESIHPLVDHFALSISIVLASIEPLRLDSSIRHGIGQVMGETMASKDHRLDLLYLIILSHGRIVNIARPKHHSIYPTDLYLLLHLIETKKSLRQPGISSWVPVCLPRFNHTGFVYASNYHLVKEDFENPEHEEVEATDQVTSGSSIASDGPLTPGQISILTVCAHREGHHEIVHLRQRLLKALIAARSLQALERATRHSRLNYQVSEVGLPGLRHFIYKSKKAVQFTMPAYPADRSDDQHRALIVSYYRAYDALTTDNERTYVYPEADEAGGGGGGGGVGASSAPDLIYGWSTSQFILLAAFHPNMGRASLKQLATALVRWCRREEGSWGMSDAPTF